MKPASSLATSTESPARSSTPKSAPTPSPVRFGIVTFHFVRNFGGTLQAFALKSFIESLGYSATIIDYVPKHVELGAPLRLFPTTRNLRANAVSCYHRAKHVGSHFFGSRSQDSQFDSFRDLCVGPDAVRYSHLNELRDHPPDVDVLMCGSDQIWNPSPQFGIDPAYFLQFGGGHVVRASYAASFGKRALDEGFHEEVGRYLSGFDLLSTREASGAEVVKSLTGTDCEVLMDPALLVDLPIDLVTTPQPAAAPSDTTSHGTLFSYLLRSREGVDVIQREIASSLGLRVVEPNYLRWHPFQSPRAVFPGPLEWLDALQAASFTVTNSFHGTVFSIMLRRPFMTLSIGSGKSQLDERSSHLLGILGLSERFVPVGVADAAQRLLGATIDWDEVHDRRIAMRDQSVQYIHRCAKLAQARSHG